MPEPEEDHARIELEQALDPELEAVFRRLCTDVRLEIDERRRSVAVDATGAELAPNYAAALLERIQRNRDAGELNQRAFEYCLAAAGEIFELEMIFFDSHFGAMIESADRS